MISYVIIAIFIITVAVASGSILLASHLRTTYKTNYFSTLLFYLIFYFTFGFYSIWGPIVITYYISSFVTEPLLVKISDITELLGSPFMIFQFLMLIRLSKEIAGKKVTGLFLAGYILLNFIVLVGIAMLLKGYHDLKVTVILKYYFVMLNLTFTFLVTYNFLLTKGRTKQLRYTDLVNLSLGLLFIMILQNSVLLFYEQNIYVGLLFIFVYFTSGIFLPVYLKYRADLSGILSGKEVRRSFKMFCEKFEISKRETEIIHEVCNGLSNQQIADKLFISLQTVKDHTHRIYIKTECNSRAQLIRLVNDNV